MVESRGGAQRRRRLPPAWIRQRSPSPFTAVADPVVGRRSGGGSGDREVRWWSGGGGRHESPSRLRKPDLIIWENAFRSRVNLYIYF